MTFHGEKITIFHFSWIPMISPGNCWLCCSRVITPVARCPKICFDSGARIPAMMMRMMMMMMMMSTVIIINTDYYYCYYYCFSLNVRKRIDDDEDGDRDDGHWAFDSAPCHGPMAGADFSASSLFARKKVYDDMRLVLGEIARVQKALQVDPGTLSVDFFIFSTGVGNCPMTWVYWTSPKIVAIMDHIPIMVGWCSMGTFNDPCSMAQLALGNPLWIVFYGALK